MLTNTRDIAALVRHTRREQGLTQAELAARIGVGRDWVVRLEQGNPRLELSKVLNALAALNLGLTATPKEPVERQTDPLTVLFESMR